MKGAGRTKKKMINDDGKKKKKGKGRKVERKKTIIITAKAKKQHHQDDPPYRPSKYVGVSWNKKVQKWMAQICVHRDYKNLGYSHDEKEAARMYDEQAALIGKPVNFPLHEGMEQAIKNRKNVSKLPNVNRPSKYVGVNWSKGDKKWYAQIVRNGKKKNLGRSEDEKEAARIYDEQAALLGRPVNFPLHEGMEQAVKPAPKRVDRSKLPNANRPSKYVGVTWNKQNKKWEAYIYANGKQRSLGYSHDEKEAARIFDEQAALLGRPVNFPLHEGMEQAVKSAPKRVDRSKLPNANRPSKYVGVSWSKQNRKWIVQIIMSGKKKFLGLYDDEKEAARIFDEQAILLGKPVNFPLHEGMKQAVKRASKTVWS